MEEFQIETAQNIGITQNVAHLGDRMLGYLVDSLVIFLYVFSVFMLLAALDLDMMDSWSVYLIASLPAFMYYVLLETFWDGRTVGKYAAKTRVVKLDGSKPAFSNFLIRWLLRIVDVTLTSGGLAVLTILLKGNGQRVGDIAAGTTVISEKQRVRLTDTLLVQLPDDYQPKYSQVTVFSDQEMQTIKNLFETAVSKGQHNVILSLFNKTKDVMQVQPEELPLDFIKRIIKDYNYFTQQM